MTLINTKLLGDRNALIIFTSQLLSSVCDKMMSIGLIWFLTKNFSINIVPWYLVVSFLPHLLMSFYSTRFINWHGPLRTVIHSEFFRGLIWLVLFALIHLGGVEDKGFLLCLFTTSFFVGVASSLFNPAILTLPPMLVEEEKVVGLNALIDSCMSISTILGSTIAIFLLNFLDIKTVILLNSLSFFWAGFLQMSLKQLPESGVHNQVDNQISPYMVIKKYPEIARLLVSFLFINLVFTPILVMMPWYVERVYFGNSSTLAAIEGAMGAGAFLVAMGLSVTNFQIKESDRIAMVSGLSFFFGVLFLFFAYSSLTWQGALAIFLIGSSTTFFNIQVLTYFQMATQPQEVPAVMTAVNIISAASVPISLSFSGLVFPHVDIPTFAKTCAVFIIIISILLPKYLRGSKWKSV
jgi:DHA3 family macrolide efflux protein-like MFS transporter